MKHPKIRVDVEPLSEARWRKVDDAVLSAIDAGPSIRPPAPARSRWVVPAVAAVAIAAGVLVYAKWPSGENVHTAPIAQAPSHIETGPGRSFVQLGFAALDVGPSSEITTSGDEEHGVLVVLEHGRVDCEVAPRKERPPFVVQAGNVRVTVVGTHFTVNRDASGTSVSVAHGIVDVAHDGTVTRVAAGEAWPPPPPEVPAPSAAPPASTSASLASPPPSVRPHLAGPTDQSQYEKAAQLERSDPEQARAIYLKLSEKGGPWASNALFAAARLASERGNASEAQRLSKQYLDRYPSGPNAEDARRLSGSR
jgi:hypothetical protein